MTYTEQNLIGVSEVVNYTPSSIIKPTEGESLQDQEKRNKLFSKVQGEGIGSFL
jgi:hypothetical protein